MSAWEPLTAVDYSLLGVAALHQAVVLLAVFHLVACRYWPPYVVKNVPLVCVTGVAGAIHLFGVVLTFGYVDYKSPSFLSNCFFQGLVTWTGAGLYYASAIVRVYRNYKVLVLHSVDMMSPTAHILIAQTPIWVATLSLLFPSVAEMDFDLNVCQGKARFVLLAAFNYAGLLLIWGMWLLWKMKNVRRQMNEYRVMILSLGLLLLSVLIMDATAGKIGTNFTLTRRVALLNNLLRAAFLFWPVIYTPLHKYAKRDQDYADSFSLGLEPSITPAMLRASLADQLKIEELWTHFQKIADEKLPPSFSAFYKAVMERDKEEGHFERQAMTMSIIDTYIHSDALCGRDLNLSRPCRQRILASEVTRYSIFAEASAEVLQVLQDRCEMAFRASPEYKFLLAKAEKDEAEMEALNKAKLVPKRKSVGFNFDDRGPGSSGSGSRSALGLGLGSRSDRWTNSTVTGSLGNRSEVASQHAGGDMDSPLHWMGEEDIEKGEAYGEECSNTGNTGSMSMSSLSIDTSRLHHGGGGSSSLFSRGLRRTSTTSPPPELRDGGGRESPPPPAATVTTATATVTGGVMSRGSNSPTSSGAPPGRPGRASPPTRPPQPQQQQQKPPPRRPPPTPWAPWRRQPSEPSIAPVTCSPSGQRDTSTSTSSSISMEEGRGGGGTGAPCFASRAGSSTASSGSLGSSSLVMLMPPSPATPPSERSSRSGVGNNFGSAASSSASAASSSSAAAGSSGVRGVDARTATAAATAAAAGEFVPVAPWRRWVNATFILEEEDEEENGDEGKDGGGAGGGGGGSGGGGGGGGGACVETCADFAAKSGFVPASSGYQPQHAWLEVAMWKEERETAAEAVMTATTSYPTAALQAVTASEEREAEAEAAAAAEEGRTLRPGSRGPNNWMPMPMSGSLKASGRGGGQGVEGDTQPRDGGIGSDGKAGSSPSNASTSTSSQRDLSPRARRRPLPLSLSSSTHSQVSFPPASPAAAHSQSSPLLHSPMSPLAEGAAPSSMLPHPPQAESPPLSSSPLSLHAVSSGTSTPPPLRGRDGGEEVDDDCDCRSPAASQRGASPPPRVEVEVEMLRPPAPATVTAPAPAPPVDAGVLGVAEEKKKIEVSWVPRPPLESEEAPPRSPQNQGFSKACVLPSDDGSSGDDQAARRKSGSDPSPAEAAAAASCPPDEPVPPPLRPPLPPVRPPGPGSDDADDLSSSSSSSGEEGREEDKEEGKEEDKDQQVDTTPERLRSPLTSPPRAERPARARKAPAARKLSRKVKAKDRRRERPQRNWVVAAGAQQAPLASRQLAAAAVEAKGARAGAAALSSPRTVNKPAETERPALAQPSSAPAWGDLPLPPAGTEGKPAEMPPPAPAPAQHLPRGAGVSFGVGVGFVPSAPTTSAALTWPPSPSLTSTSATSPSPPFNVLTETTQPLPSTAPVPAQAPAPQQPAPAAATAATAAAAAPTAQGEAPLPLLASPPARTSPVALSLTTVGALPCHLLFTPPSPAGRSSSTSPTSSLKSSPAAAVRPPLLPPAAALSGGGSRDRDRELPPSAEPGPGFPLVWSFSSSTLSGGSRGSRSTGGRGGGMSSVSASASASVSSDMGSPLVGVRFVAGGGGAGAGAGDGAGAGATGGAGASKEKERSRPNSWSDRDHGRGRGQGQGHPLLGVRGSVPLPLALCGVGRSMQGEAAAPLEAVVRAFRPPVTLPVVGAGAGAVPAGGEEASFEVEVEGGVGGRRGKRPRRYFFP